MSGHREDAELPGTGLTLREARARLTALHFAKEMLTPVELEALYLAEGLLRLVDRQAMDNHTATPDH